MPLAALKQGWGGVCGSLLRLLGSKHHHSLGAQSFGPSDHFELQAVAVVQRGNAPPADSTDADEGIATPPDTRWLDPQGLERHLHSHLGRVGLVDVPPDIRADDIRQVFLNLGKMTATSRLKPMSNTMRMVVHRLTDPDEIRRARLHLLEIVVTFVAGRQDDGDRGKLIWVPGEQVVNALDEAPYFSFDQVQPTGQRYALSGRPPRRGGF